MLTTQKTDDVLEQVQREINWVFHGKDTCTHFVGTCSVCGERRYAEITKQIEEARKVHLDVADSARI